MEKAEKTNAMRILEQKGEAYTPFYLSAIPEDGKAAAEMLKKQDIGSRYARCDSRRDHQP